MMDDVLVHGSTREEHDASLRDVLNRLQTAGMTLNERKTLQFFRGFLSETC